MVSSPAMSDDIQDDPNRGMAHLTARVYEICRLIPAGRVTTYGKYNEATMVLRPSHGLALNTTPLSSH